jgi:hypothetical protein
MRLRPSNCAKLSWNIPSRAEGFGLLLAIHRLYAPRMNEHDQQRFAKMISDFVEGCGFARPFHLLVIDARGTASVTRYGRAGVEQVCSGPAKANRLKMIPPLVATVISSDGVGRTAKIEIIEARATMQTWCR